MCTYAWCGINFCITWRHAPQGIFDVGGAPTPTESINTAHGQFNRLFALADLCEKGDSLGIDAQPILAFSMLQPSITLPSSQRTAAPTWKFE